MFAAGRESKMRLVNLWRILAALAMVIAALFATLYLTRSQSGELNDRPAPRAAQR